MSPHGAIFEIFTHLASPTVHPEGPTRIPFVQQIIYLSELGGAATEDFEDDQIPPAIATIISNNTDCLTQTASKADKPSPYNSLIKMVEELMDILDSTATASTVSSFLGVSRSSEGRNIPWNLIWTWASPLLSTMTLRCQDIYPWSYVSHGWRDRIEVRSALRQLPQEVKFLTLVEFGDEVLAVLETLTESKESLRALEGIYLKRCNVASSNVKFALLQLAQSRKRDEERPDEEGGREGQSCGLGVTIENCNEAIMDHATFGELKAVVGDGAKWDQSGEEWGLEGLDG